MLSSLRPWTFGEYFNHCLQGVRLPCSLQPLTFGECFNGRLQGVALSGNPQPLAFWRLQPELARCCTADQPAAVDFNRGSRGVALRSSLDKCVKVELCAGFAVLGSAAQLFISASASAGELECRSPLPLLRGGGASGSRAAAARAGCAADDGRVCMSLKFGTRLL
jgi:hypothetical protein